MVSIYKEYELKNINKLVNNKLSKNLSSVILKYLTININKLKLDQYLNNYFNCYYYVTSIVNIRTIINDNKWFINMFD
jgi:hypothetical protein